MKKYQKRTYLQDYNSTSIVYFFLLVIETFAAGVFNFSFKVCYTPVRIFYVNKLNKLTDIK